jgi:hypothetical protein
MVNFPVSFDNDASLYLVVNNKRTQLTSSINNSTLTIPVVSTAGFPSVGFITILSSGDITKAEAIKYTSIDATNFFATQRGAGNTIAVTHNISDNVDLTVVADHHNELKDAVIALENFVGISGAENFLRIDDFGNVVVPNSLTVSGGSTFSFITVTGTFTGNTGFFSTSVRSPVVSGTTVNTTTLNVFSNSVMRGNLTVTGTATVGTLVVTGTTTVTGTSHFVGDMSVDNQVTVGFNPNWVTVSGKTVSAGLLLADSVAASSSLTISGSPVSTGTSNPVESLNSRRGLVTVTGIGSAHTIVQGQIITVSGEASSVPDPLNIGTVHVSNLLTISGVPVATGTTIPDPLNIGSAHVLTSLTISGVPVATGTSPIPDPLNIGTLNASNSLTISGVPVATGVGVSSLNALRNDVLISGTGSVTTSNIGQLILVSGTQATVPDPLTIGTVNATSSLTISGVPVATGVGVLSLNTLQGNVVISGTGTITVSGVGQLITISGNPSSVPDPLTAGTINATNSLTISGVPVATGIGKSVVLAGLTADQTTNLTAGTDHVKWNTAITSMGPKISLDTATTYSSSAGPSIGRFTLQAGTYEIFCAINCSFSSAAGDVQLRIQTDTASQTGAVVALRTLPTSNTGNLSGNGTTMAIVRPASGTRYEVFISAGGTLTTIESESYCRIMEL